MDHHRRNDAQGDSDASNAMERIGRMQRHAHKLRDWLAANPQDRPGTRGSIRKSNITDNESAKLATDKGVLQGYCGVAVVDSAHQIIVAASAHGTGSEQALLLASVDACKDQRNPDTLITADAGYHSEANLAALAEHKINALIADNQMRQRDERFAEQGKHKLTPNPLHNKAAQKKTSVFGSEQFIVADDQSHALCPAGKRLYRSGKNCTVGNYHALKFKAPISACKDCTLRAQCLRKPHSTRARQVAVLTQKSTQSHTQTMREKIDSVEGRRLYGQRFAVVEPVFANIRHNKRLNRFTLRGQNKVDGQWKLFALVHNIEKYANLRKAA